MANPVFILSSILDSEFFFAKNVLAFVSRNSKGFVVNLNERDVANLFWKVIFVIDYHQIYKIIRFLEYINNIYKVLYINYLLFSLFEFWYFFYYLNDKKS